MQSAGNINGHFLIVYKDTCKSTHTFTILDLWSHTLMSLTHFRALKDTRMQADMKGNRANLPLPFFLLLSQCILCCFLNHWLGACRRPSRQLVWHAASVFGLSGSGNRVETADNFWRQLRMRFSSLDSVHLTGSSTTCCFERFGAMLLRI